MKELQVARLSAATIYRVFFFGSLFGCIPILFLLGVLGYSGPFNGAFFALFGTATFGSTVALGLWLKSKSGPLAIQYRDSGVDA